MNPEYLALYHENRLGITFFEFVLLVLIEQQQHDTLLRCWEDNFTDFEYKIRVLEEAGYVKWHGDKMSEISLRKKGEDLFKNINKLSKKANSDVNTWIDAWRDMFPAGINTAGYRYRGNRLEVLKKMIKFVAQYKFSREEIFEATLRYVERFSARGYMYMEQAHYFIEKKERGSSLATECESLKEQQTLQTETTNYGRRVV